MLSPTSAELTLPEAPEKTTRNPRNPIDELIANMPVQLCTGRRGKAPSVREIAIAKKRLALSPSTHFNIKSDIFI